MSIVCVCTYSLAIAIYYYYNQLLSLCSVLFLPWKLWGRSSFYGNVLRAFTLDGVVGFDIRIYLVFHVLNYTCN